MSNKNLLTRNLLYDKIAEKAFYIIGFSCIFILFLITFFLFKEGLPIFGEIGVIDFIFGKDWYPTSEPPHFGIAPLIIASVFVTLLAIIIAIPISLAIAIYMSELATPLVREIVKPTIELIASIPSVIIGFFGMVVVAPLLQEYFDLDTGLNLFNGALMLAFMVIPTIASIAEDSISSVPLSLKEASYALGSNKWQTIFFIILPASLSGIWTAIILGISRVIGETMVVLMVCGGAAIIPTSIFTPIRPLTSNIAAEMAEAAVGDSHYYALFMIAVILFFLTFGFNILAHYLTNKYKFKTN